MPHIIVRQDFKFAHGGHRVEEFVADDQPIETTDECAELAIAEGWAEDADKLEEQRMAAEQAAQAEAERMAAEQAAQAEADRQAAAQAEVKAEPAAPANKDAAPKRSTKTAA